ncbi:MAG TPA: CPBP family intramembrane glutamic endopeptidase [Gammaproteobacteria bacterium]|jgi:hypothetical protein
MQDYLQLVLVSTAIDLALLLPFFLAAYVTAKPRPSPRPALLFAAFVLMDVALIYSHRVLPLIPSWGGWNWQGKFLEAAVPVLLALLLPAAFPAVRMGLKLPEQRSRWRALPIACVLYALIGIPVMLLMGAHLGINTDTPRAVFEATMPGLGEEIMYRGLLLLVLNEAFGRPWKFAGIQLGWGFVIVTAMFGFIHGIEVKAGGGFAVNFYWSAMIFPAATGAVLAWLRERTGSVWPSVLFHNFVNTVNDFLV